MKPRENMTESFINAQRYAHIGRGLATLLGHQRSHGTQIKTSHLARYYSIITFSERLTFSALKSPVYNRPKAPMRLKS